VFTSQEIFGCVKHEDECIERGTLKECMLNVLKNSWILHTKINQFNEQKQ
jgi:hypothetical protein